MMKEIERIRTILLDKSQDQRQYLSCGIQTRGVTGK